MRKESYDATLPKRITLERSAQEALSDLKGHLRPAVYDALCAAWVVERVTELGQSVGWARLPPDLRAYRWTPTSDAA